jgi:ubiquinone/menaquinone biosynthesis C-methylase UbiE
MEDIRFWVKRAEGASSTLIVGCGTGRVINPVAGRQPDRAVGIDVNLARLRRASARTSASLVCADVRQMPFKDESFDLLVFPYSGFQLLGRVADRCAFMVSARRVMTRDGRLWLDVSTRFEERSSQPRALVARGWSSELQAEVEEYETLQSSIDAILIIKEFTIADHTILCLREEWIFARSLQIESIARACGLSVVDVHYGYTEARSPHRALYELRCS